MSLVVKDPETHELIRELADLLGVSKTQAVTLAVEGRLALEHQTIGRREASIRSTISEIRQHVLPGPSTGEQDAELYDDDGLSV